jgi:hypothetical protein
VLVEVMVTDWGGGLEEFNSAKKLKVVPGTFKSGWVDINSVTGMVVVVGEPVGVFTVTVPGHEPPERFVAAL